MNKTLLAVAILGVLACHCSLGATEDEKTVEWWKDCGSESDHGKVCFFACFYEILLESADCAHSYRS